MKSTALLVVFIAFGMNLYAQKKSYDIATYTPPNCWTEKQVEGSIYYSKTDGDSWAQIAIYKHRSSDGNINTDFDKDWKELVATNSSISTPEKTKPQTEKGWTVMSGSGLWQYNGANVASMLTVYTNNKVCMAVLCNSTAQPYLKNYKNLIGSLLIGNPPGITTGFENKAFTSSSSQASTATAVNTINLPFAGKIWEGSSPEKAGAGNMQYYTGGFFTNQYVFNADGTYRFVNVNASAFTNSKSLNYETGTWSVSGNQLTIIPIKGKDEEWTTIGKTSNGNSDVTNRKIMDTWNRKTKASGRKLEKYTYTFSIDKNGDKNALILQRSGRTEREGEGKISYYNETSAGQSVKLPAGIN